MRRGELELRKVGTKNRLFDGRVMANLALYYIDWKEQQITTAFTFPTGGIVVHTQCRSYGDQGRRA